MRSDRVVLFNEEAEEKEATWWHKSCIQKPFISYDFGRTAYSISQNYFKIEP
jgi:hypothetical protein